MAEMDDLKYTYLTKCIGDSDLATLKSCDLILLGELKCIMAEDPEKTYEIRTDLKDVPTLPGSVVSTLLDHCRNMTDDTGEYNLLIPEEDNSRSFRMLDRCTTSSHAVVKIPEYNEYHIEKWMTSRVITYDQFEYLRLLGIRTLSWKYEDLTSYPKSLSSIKTVETPQAGSKNELFLLGALGIATIFCNMT